MLVVWSGMERLLFQSKQGFSRNASTTWKKYVHVTVNSVLPYAWQYNFLEDNCTCIWAFEKVEMQERIATFIS
jgi:hypothetical protein